MSTTTKGTAGYDRRRELQAFDDTKAGVKGLVDASVTTIPPIFHHPPDSLATSSTATIPVIDLSGRRSEVVGEVRAATETVGFFQVVNHGVPADLLAEMLASVRRFHESPAEAKTPHYTRDLARKLAVRVLARVWEAMGLAPDRLEKMGCADGLSVVSNYYPPCPQPHLTLGTSRHSDPAFLTVLLQDDMAGLQVLVDDDGEKRAVWADVPPVPGALVINVGDLLQLVSNGRLKSVEHRVVANRSRDRARISVAAFFNADLRQTTAVYGPIEEQVTSSAPPLYRSITVEEFLSHYDGKGLDGRPALDHFLLP
uniref:1-aminocyclopropane-1-carboxylate oxidase-4-like protein n=1 Tax=Aegilops tauschii TaxID=37682 RepID=N1R451_AEGTA